MHRRRCFLPCGDVQITTKMHCDAAELLRLSQCFLTVFCLGWLMYGFGVSGRKLCALLSGEDVFFALRAAVGCGYERFHQLNMTVSVDVADIAEMGDKYIFCPELGEH